MFTPEEGHALAAPDTHPEPPSEPTEATPPPVPQLALAWLDRLAATSFIGGSTDDLAAWTQDCARSLAGVDRNEARVRLLCRNLAAAAAHMSSLEVMLGRAVTACNERAVDLINRTLTATTKRFAMLLAEHRAETAVQQRPTVVAVGHAEQVTIQGSR